MNCAKCGLDMPAGVKQCPKCGLINEFEQSEQQEPRKKKTVLYVIIALGLIALAAITFAAIMAGKAKNVTSAPGGNPSPSGNVLSAPSGKPSDSGVMSAPPGAPAPGGTTPPAANKPKPSQAMLDYLQFAKKVELIRENAIVNNDLASVIAFTDPNQMTLKAFDMVESDSDPLSEVKNQLDKLDKAMLLTLEMFDKAAAPSECREFSKDFRALLYIETETIHEIASSFKNISISNLASIPDFVKSIKQKQSDPTVKDASVEQLAKNADAELDSLVSIYDMKKPFEVLPEKAGSSGIMGASTPK